jgi:hypothetical protein
MFELNDAIRVLKHYMIREMILFLDLSGAGEPIIADFYYKMFKEIEKDRKIINLSNKEITKWTDTIKEETTIIRVKYYDVLKEEETLFNVPYKQFTDDVYSDPIFNSKLITNKDVEDEELEQEKLEQEQELRDIASTELGEDAHEQLVDDFVSSAKEEEEIDNELDNEIFNPDDQQEGDDNIEYGDPEQGIENEVDDKKGVDEILEYEADEDEDVDEYQDEEED